MCADARSSPRPSSTANLYRGTSLMRAEDAQGTPTQSHISPSILVYSDKSKNELVCYIGRRFYTGDCNIHPQHVTNGQIFPRFRSRPDHQQRGRGVGVFLWARYPCNVKGGFNALSGQPRAYLAVGRQIKVNYVWAFAAKLPI